MGKELFACAPIVLSLALGAARPACAASPPEVATALEVDTRLLDPEVGARIESQLLEQLGPALADVGYAIGGEGSSAAATVRVRVIAFDPEARDYEVEVQALRAGEEPIGGTVICNACSESRLVGRIVEAAPELVEVKDVKEPVAEPVEAEPVVEPTARRRRELPIGAMGFTGAALSVGGIIAASIGIDTLEKGVVEHVNLNLPDTAIDDYVPAGATSLALGATALIAGVVLVAADAKRRGRTGPRYALHVARAFWGFQVVHNF